MTVTEFSKNAERKLSEKIGNIVWCVFIILFSLFFQIKFFKLFSMAVPKTNLPPIVYVLTLFLLLMLLGFYGLFALINPLKVSRLENKLAKDNNLELIEKVFAILKGKDFQSNDNLVQFVYKKSFWSYKQKINFLVEDNLIAIYVTNIDSNPKGGFVDFGAKSRLQNKILNIIEDKASQ
jgi:hypothetical protein